VFIEALTDMSINAVRLSVELVETVFIW
jgi:hypothetical protein